MDPDFQPEDEVIKKKTYFTAADLLEEIEEETPSAEAEVGKDLPKQTNKTKKLITEVRKKRYRTLESQMKNNKQRHPIKADFSCACKYKCMENFPFHTREKIYEGFWKVDRHQQRVWLSTKVIEKPAYRRIQEGRRKNTRFFFLPKHFENNEDHCIRVCQKMFLATLGFKTDTILKTVLAACKDSDGNNKVVIPNADKRGKHQNHHKKNLDLIESHILSFKPRLSHYRRYHAPNRRYLPPDLSIKYMHEDFNLKHPNHKIVYETYRQVVNSMNIGFTEDAPEKCGICMEYEVNPTPENVLLKNMHLLKVQDTRQNYKQDKENRDPDTIVYTVDMQKVILLPRMPDVKDSFFLSRLILFNESFVSLKPKDKHLLVIWHEAIAGRNAEDVSSAFLAFFLKNRDVKNIILWLDNCTSQNKNWVLYSSILNYINSDLSTTKEICLKYLVKGHTFMAADGIHGKIEQQMRKQKNVYDVQDFIEVCEKAAKRNRILSLTIGDFMDLKSIIRQRKSKERGDTLPYLKDVVEIKFERGLHDFFYKTDYQQPYIKSSNILKRKSEVGTFPEKKTTPRGIKESKKEQILKELVPKMADSRKQFWINLHVNDGSEDLLEEGV